MSQVLEAIMVLCFGASWPFSIRKSYKARTSKGKSIYFLGLVIVGYSAGILSKLISGNITYVLYFYIANTIMVSIDTALYFRNLRLDLLRAREEGQADR